MYTTTPNFVCCFSNRNVCRSMISSRTYSGMCPLLHTRTRVFHMSAHVFANPSPWFSLMQDRQCSENYSLTFAARNNLSFFTLLLPGFASTEGKPIPFSYGTVCSTTAKFAKFSKRYKAEARKRIALSCWCRSMAEVL